VDGDPGGADVRESVARLAHEGSRAGIHVICLAETASASPASPVTDTYEAACETSPPFRECGAVALLSGDVATALRLLRVAPGASPEATTPGRGETPYSGSTDSFATDSFATNSFATDSFTTHAGSTHAGSARFGSTHGGPKASGTAGSGPAHDGDGRTHDDPSHGEPPRNGGSAAPHAGRTAAGSTHGSSAHTGSARGGSAHTASTHGSSAQTASNTRPGALHPASPASTPIGPVTRGPVGRGTVAAVDAVSVAWAERFARA
jgi:hypothetical protein